MKPQAQISKARLIFGGTVIVVGFMSPLLIPYVASLDWSIGLKSAISGLLALGIPEVFMIIGVAILGKDGYQFLKEKLFGLLKQFAPPDKVSIKRHRIGLVMFCSPLLIGWIGPYLAHVFPDIKELPLWSYIIGDFVFIASFMVLGGNFWDKLSGLFKHDVTVSLSE